MLYFQPNLYTARRKLVNQAVACMQKTPAQTQSHVRKKPGWRGARNKGGGWFKNDSVPLLHLQTLLRGIRAHWSEPKRVPLAAELSMAQWGTAWSTAPATTCRQGWQWHVYNTEIPMHGQLHCTAVAGSIYKELCMCGLVTLSIEHVHARMHYSAKSKT